MNIPTDLMSYIERALEIGALIAGALLAAFWMSMIVWTFSDIRSRSRDIFFQLLSALLVLLLGPIGLLLYFVLRPRETLAGAYARTLEEEALLQDIEERRVCPNCKRRVGPDFMFCPHCHTRLKKACPGCGRLLRLQWDICPYCGSTLPVQASASEGQEEPEATEGEVHPAN